MSIVLHGVAAGKGIAIGHAHLITRGAAEVPQYDIDPDKLEAEVARFDNAIKATRKELEQLRSAIPENAPTELGAFISLHLMLLTDVTLSREPIDILREQKINAEWALKQQSDKLAAQFDSIDDDYLRERKQDMLQVVRRELNKIKKTAATTADGINIELLANIESAEDIKALHNFGADGVGLFRSEFLYLNRDTMPSEDEQYEVYSAIVKKMKGKSITVRTVDLGVDKNPRWFGQNSTPNGSLNPALGLTGIRLCLAEPVMFRTQMRAILRAAAHGPVRMMWPMITSLSEVRQCLIHLDTAQRQLAERGETFGTVSVGCMIEIPSAALTVGSILKLVDFISIGTNDLIQYILSVDRGDDSVSHLYQPGHPAVLKMLQHIIRTANRMEKSVSICGEMAGDTAYTRMLLGMGLRRFSMNPNNLLPVKNIILHSNTALLETETAKILRSEDSEKTEKLLKLLNSAEHEEERQEEDSPIAQA